MDFHYEACPSGTRHATHAVCPVLHKLKENIGFKYRFGSREAFLWAQVLLQMECDFLAFSLLLQPKILFLGNRGLPGTAVQWELWVAVRGEKVVLCPFKSMNPHKPCSVSKPHSCSKLIKSIFKIQP